MTRLGHALNQPGLVPAWDEPTNLDLLEQQIVNGGTHALALNRPGDKPAWDVPTRI